MKTHFSAIDTHRKCPQRYAYRYIEGLSDVREDTPTPPLEIGSWWHAVKAAESLERGRARQTLKKVPRKLSTVDNGPTFDGSSVTASEVLTALDEWWTKLGDEKREAYTEFCGQDVPTRIEKMFEQWQERWAEDIENEDPLAVEMYWERVLQKPGEKREGLKLFGFIDEIVWDRKREQVVVRDHKTMKVMKEPDVTADRMSPQLQMYGWGAEEIVKGWGFKGVSAVEFDRVRTSAPKTPKVNLDGTLSKSVKDFDLETYLEWSKGEDGQGVYFKGRKAGGQEAGYYTAEDEVIERLSTPSAKSEWNQRSRLPINPKILRGHLVSIVLTSKSMTRTEKNYGDMGAVERDISAGCKWCPFMDLCFFQLENGEDAEYDPADFGLKRSKRSK